MMNELKATDTAHPGLVDGEIRMTLSQLRTQSIRRTPARLLKHLKSFAPDLKFPAGAGDSPPGSGRFHDRDFAGNQHKTRGMLKALLIRARAMCPRSLSPLPRIGD
jgi:hypothetical protein